MSRDRSILPIEPSGATSTPRGWYGCPASPVAWQIVSVSTGATRSVKDPMYTSTPARRATTPDATRSVLSNFGSAKSGHATSEAYLFDSVTDATSTLQWCARIDCPAAVQFFPG